MVRILFIYNKFYLEAYSAPLFAHDSLIKVNELNVILILVKLIIIQI